VDTHHRTRRHATEVRDTRDQVVHQQIIRMYVRNWDNNIATVYPASTQCP